jgi:hypothetical protein
MNRENRNKLLVDETAMILESKSTADGVKALAAAGVGVLLAKKDLDLMYSHIEDHAETLRMIKTAMDAVMHAAERLDDVYSRFLRLEVENIKHFHARHANEVDPDCVLCDRETKGVDQVKQA